MKITVFTPTYNRGYIIGKLYDSLKRQTYTDFEWLVIDDGSTDNTQQLFKAFQKQDNFFPIRYYKVENGGKHRAINKAVKLAKGELFFTVDSDDYLPDDALNSIINTEKTILDNQKRKFAGLCGLKSYSNSIDIGSTFEGDFLDISILERYKYNIIGDKAEIFYTNVLKNFPFPEYEGENFCTESIVWDRLSYAGYKLRFFNKSVYMCNYLEDGLTHQGLLLYAKNPQQWGTCISQDLTFKKYKPYEISIQVYKFYLCEKHKLTMSQISKYLHMSKSKVLFFVLFQTVLDVFRGIITGLKIKDQCLEVQKCLSQK